MPEHPPAPEGLRLRLGTPDDVAATCRLLAAVLPESPKGDEATYRWQYWDNPWSPPAIRIWEADDGRVVAHGGGYAVRARLHGREVVLGHRGDAAVDRAFRGHRLFESIARARLEDSKALGWTASRSIPNTASMPTHRRTGLLELGQIAAYVRPVDVAALLGRAGGPAAVRQTSALLARAARVPWTRGGVEVDDAPEALGDLWDRTEPGAAGTLRDAAYVRWRYRAHPSVAYRSWGYGTRRAPRGYAVTRVVERSGTPWLYVADLWAEDGRAARAALGAAIHATADAEGVAGVALLTMPGSRTAALAARAGFLRLPRRLEPQPQVLGAHPHTTTEDALRSARWSVSWGDHDHL